MVDPVPPAAPTSLPKDSPEAEPVGYIIRRPVPSDEGASLLFLTRPSSGMFGSSSGTAIFAIDQMVVDTKTRIATARSRQGDISFSSDLPFLIIPRGLATPVSTRDLAAIQMAEKKEWDAVMESDEIVMSAVGETTDGRKTSNPGQYL